jgi:hypothetical protein
MTGSAILIRRRRALAAARALLVVGCAFALLFVAGSRIGEGFSVMGLLNGLAGVGVIAVLVMLGWRAPRIAGWLLVVVALLLVSLQPTTAVSLLVAAPPLLDAALFLWGTWPAGGGPS